MSLFFTKFVKLDPDPHGSACIQKNCWIRICFESVKNLNTVLSKLWLGSRKNNMFYSRVEVVVGDGAKAGQKNGSGSTQKPWLRQP